MGELPQARKRPQFGISPTELLERNPDEKVPSILSSCVNILLKGLFSSLLFLIYFFLLFYIFYLNYF